MDLTEWEPGRFGKGFMLAGGDVYLWAVDGGYDGIPFHETVLESRYKEFAARPYFR